MMTCEIAHPSTPYIELQKKASAGQFSTEANNDSDEQGREAKAATSSSAAAAETSASGAWLRAGGLARLADFVQPRATEREHNREVSHGLP